MRALVFSGGGLFGAWQAGAWRALAPRFQPDLIVGCSVGALNGYAIAAGASPEKLEDLWLREELSDFSKLGENLRTLATGPLRSRLAIVITDLLRLKPRIVEGSQITWQHLAASCAVPLVLPQVMIDGRWYGDGGLLNPLPLWAAAELGATEIVGLNALPRVPSLLMRPFVMSFRALFGYHPPLPAGVRATVIKPPRDLGSISDALRWKEGNARRWFAQGFQDASTHSI
jgi:NTE family protein